MTLRVMLQIVPSFTDDSRGVIYDHNMFIVHPTGVEWQLDLNPRSQDQKSRAQPLCYSRLWQEPSLV
jgi:hypothetical protein